MNPHFEYMIMLFWFFGDPAEPEDTEGMIAEEFRNLESDAYRRKLVRRRLNGFEFGRRWVAPTIEWVKGVLDAVRKR